MSMTTPADSVAPDNSRPSSPKKTPSRGWKWFRRLVGLVLVLVLLVAVVLYGILFTATGRDFVLKQASQRLPAGMAFSWKTAQGQLAGPLTLEGVEFRQDDLKANVGHVNWDLKLRPLLQGKVMIPELVVRDAEVNLPKSEEKPFELPRWPDVLPKVELPVSIHLPKVEVDRFTLLQEGKKLVMVQELRANLDLQEGGAKVTALTAKTNFGDVDLHGHYWPRDNFATDIEVKAVLPPQGVRVLEPVTLTIKGDLKNLGAHLQGKVPEPISLQLNLLDPQLTQNPTWKLATETKGLDLYALGFSDTSNPMQFALNAEGQGGAGTLQGSFQQGELALQLQPSQLKVEQQVLTVSPLLVDIFKGHVMLEGTADFNKPENPQFNMAIHANNLEWGTPGSPAIHLEKTDLVVKGEMNQWSTEGSAAIKRDKQNATVNLNITGNSTQAVLNSLQAQTPGGRLDAKGTVDWQPQLKWDIQAALAGFDPGYFVPDWSGRLSGQVNSQGQQRPNLANGNADGFDLTAVIPSITGQLRQRAVNLRADVKLQGTQGQGDIALSMGQSRVTARGRVSATAVDVQAAFEPFQLNDVLPDGSGQLRGTVAVRGSLQTPQITADITGQTLRFQTYEVGDLRLNGNLPWQGTQGNLRLNANKVNVGTVLPRIALEAKGAISQLQLDAEVASEFGTVALATNIKNTAGRWVGSLQRLLLTPSRGAPWQLDAPSQFEVNGAAWSFTSACLVANGGGRLCTEAQWPKQGVQLNANAFPLALINPWLPPSDGRPLVLQGNVDIQAALKPEASAFRGFLRLASATGGVSVGGQTNRSVMRFDNFSLNTEFNPQAIVAKLGTGFAGAGFINADVTTGWDANSPLNGNVALNMSQLVWLELFSPDLVNPQGLVEGNIRLGGTRSEPSLGGNAVLSQFRGELPALGLMLTEGNVRLDASQEGAAQITGSIRSGEGTLNVNGRLSLFGTASPIEMTIQGNNVQVANTPDIKAVANPNLRIQVAGSQIQLRGDVTVPSATLDLEQLDQAASVSPDVVVLDPIVPQTRERSSIDIDLAVVLGEKVNINGFGLKAQLKGEMRIRAIPGREMTANGSLNVAGRYKAYGQDLNISRGQILWNNSIISDPRINIRAERQVGAVTAGIDVTGRAEAPRIAIWSDPDMPTSQALSYIILGRSLDVVTSSQASQVSAASSALAAGSGLIAAQLGARLGLDDAGVSESRALGGSVIGVGKYITPRLYVSYGVSMVGAGQVVMLKFLIRQGLSTELESSTVENRGSVNYRFER